MKAYIKSKLDYHLGIIESLRNTSEEDFLQIAKYELEQYANQLVIEELEKQMELAEVGNSYTRLRERIQELKQ